MYGTFSKNKFLWNGSQFIYFNRMWHWENRNTCMLVACNVIGATFRFVPVINKIDIKNNVKLLNPTGHVMHQ